MEERTDQRFCRHCLMAEADPDRYQKELRDYIERIGNNRVGEKEYRDRLALCKACEKLSVGTCLLCGCYVEIRAAAKTGHCPRKIW